jgi:hypothetical protein
MKGAIKKTVASQYPKWHNNPLSLTTGEIRHPDRVLNDFFENYSITETRHSLNEWMQHYIRKAGIDAVDQVLFHERIEKLVEAASLLNRRIKKNSRKSL